MIRPTDEKMIVNERIVTVPKREGMPCHAMPCHAVPHEQASESVRRQEQQEEKMDKSLYCGFPQNIWMKQYKQPSGLLHWIVWIILADSGL